MSWKELFPMINFLQNYEQIPKILKIYCGGNGIGKIIIKGLRTYEINLIHVSLERKQKHIK